MRRPAKRIRTELLYTDDEVHLERLGISITVKLARKLWKRNLRPFLPSELKVKRSREYFCGPLHPVSNLLVPSLLLPLREAVATTETATKSFLSEIRLPVRVTLRS